VIEHTGWTWEYVDWNMDLPRLFSMSRYWRKHPSVRAMVQAYLGIKPEALDSPSGNSISSNKTESENSEKDLAEFMQAFTSIGGKTG
jgi:hypothetical protein